MLANADGSYTLFLSIHEIREIETGFVPERIQEEFAEALREDTDRDDVSDDDALDDETDENVLNESVLQDHSTKDDSTMTTNFRTPQENLEHFRHIAAISTFDAWSSNIEADDIVYAEEWQHTSNEFSRVVSLKDPDTSEPDSHIFTITFAVGTDCVESIDIEGETYSAATIAIWRAQNRQNQ